MYVVYINLLYFLSIFLFTYNKNLLSQKNNVTINLTMITNSRLSSIFLNCVSMRVIFF